MRIKFMVFFVIGFCALSLAQNPIIRNQFTADPTVRVFNDTLYLYCSHDIPAPEDYARKDWFCMHDYHVFSSADLVNWKDHGVQFSQDDVDWVKHRSYSMWAPDCVKASGKYWLYFPAVAKEAVKDEIFGVGVATSNTPQGPFVPIQQRIDGIKGIDPGVFIDDDGQKYIYWAQEGLHGAKLDDSMTRLDGNDVLLFENQEGAYKEAPFVFKRNGMYYLTFACQMGPAEALVYAIGSNPLGPFEYKGIIMDIIPEPLCWTNHHSIIRFKGNWYLFYHHNDYSPDRDMLRSVRVDSLAFDKDGLIHKVTPTLRGVGRTKADSKIQIDRYSDLTGIGASINFVDADRPFDGWFVTLSKPGDKVRYNNVSFDGIKIQAISIRHRSRQSSDLNVRLGNKTSAIRLPATNDWRISNINLDQTINGVVDVSLQMNSGDTDIDWINFIY